ncbi:9227_t:CDS:2, partial [Racocetra fulgida]
EGQQPVKYVKARICTLSKRRAASMAELFNQEPPETSLYGEWQTEEYKSEPVIDVNITINFNNLKIYWGLLVNGVGKIAKKLHIDYGDAVVGFDFQSRRCIPVVKGIVVPEEHREILMEHVAAVNEAKKQKEISDRQKKLKTKLQVQQRIQETYGKEEEILAEDLTEDEENELYHGDTDEEKNSSHQ